MNYKLSQRELVLVIVLALALVGINLPYKSFDPELEPYQRTFMYMANSCPKLFYPAKQWIQFSDKLDDGVAADCRRAPGWFSIRVNRDVWKMLDKQAKYELMVHEMAHCYLKLEHQDKKGYYLNPELQADIPSDTVDRQLTNDILDNCFDK